MYLDIKVQAEIIAPSAFEFFWFSAGATKISLGADFVQFRSLKKTINFQDQYFRNQTCNKSFGYLRRSQIAVAILNSILKLTHSSKVPTHRKRSKIEIYKDEWLVLHQTLNSPYSKYGIFMCLHTTCIIIDDCIIRHFRSGQTSFIEFRTVVLRDALVGSGEALAEHETFKLSNFQHPKCYVVMML